MGGSFDPIHVGHLIIAEEAKVELDLARVIFIPAGQPYFKEGRDVAPAHHRLEMVRLAIASNPHFQMSAVEINKPGFSYSVDTLEVLRGELGEDREIYFILGWDSIVTLPQWKDLGWLLKLCKLVGVPRPGWARPDLEELESAAPGALKRITLLNRPLMDISSTEIRSRISRSVSVRYLVSRDVEEYITKHGLYEAVTQ